MRKLKRMTRYIFSMLLFLSGVMCLNETVSAEDKYEAYFLPGAPETESCVNDFAGVFTEEEIRSFEGNMQKMEEEYDCNVVAVVLDEEKYDSSELKAPEAFSEEFLNLDGHRSTVVLWLNVCRDNRSIYLLGYGSAERKITDDDAKNITEDLKQYVIRQQSEDHYDNHLYVEMMDEFIDQVDTEMRRPFFYLTWWFQLGLGVILGLIVVGILVRNIGGKITTTGKTYMNKTFSEMIGRRDIYTHTTYVRTKKSSSSGGRSGGGGHSHSSGGGRF